MAAAARRAGSVPRGSRAEVEHLRHFMVERFHSESEAASFLGGAAGLRATLNFEEFARALRLSGYGRPPEPLFAHFAGAAPSSPSAASLSPSRGAGTVSVQDLLRECGLPQEVRSSPGRGSPPLEPRARPASWAGAVAAEPVTTEALGRQAQGHLTELRNGIAAARQQVQEAASEPRQPRAAGGGLGSAEEGWAREANSLRAEGADLRASLTEALRLLAEERKERQGHLAESQRRMMELQDWAEDRVRRVEALAREGSQATADASDARFLQQGAVAELEGRWRRVIAEERAARSRETEELAAKVRQLEEAFRAEHEAAAQMAEATVHMQLALRDLRADVGARHAEAAARAAGLGDRDPLQGAVEAIGRRLEAVEHAMQLLGSREGAGVRMEESLRGLLFEERRLREEVTSQLEQRLSALQQEISFERARAAAQGREFSQALAQAKESIAAESSTRKQEAAALVRPGEELLHAIREGETRQQRVEARVLDHASAIEAALREERDAREEAIRHLVDDLAALRSTMVRESGNREELSEQLTWQLEEQRRRLDITAEADQLAQLQAQLPRLHAMLDDERRAREQSVAAVEQRLLRGESARAAEREQRDEWEKAIAPRISQAVADAADARDRVREGLSWTEEAAVLRDLIARERGERQVAEASVELAVREQQARLDALQQAGEAQDRHLERRLGDLAERLESEIRRRADGSAEAAQHLASRRDELTAALSAERRRTDEALAKTTEALREAVSEEQARREEELAALETKLAQIRGGADEGAKWRIEQRSEVALEVSKLSEALADEARARLREAGELGSGLARLREELAREAAARKEATGALQEDLAEALRRLDRGQEALIEQERQRLGVAEATRRELAAETARQGSALDQMRLLLEREADGREEALASATRAWQKGLAKASEDWRAALRAEVASREEAHLRLEQQLIEVRGAMHEVRANFDQREDEVVQRLKAAAEALSFEDHARRAQDAQTQRALEDLRKAIAAEAAQRQAADEQLAGRARSAEELVREEAAAREEVARRLQKELQEARAVASEDRGAREELSRRFEASFGEPTARRHEALLQEARVREESLATLITALQKALQGEQAALEEHRRDCNGRLQMLREELQQEREEWARFSRELSAAVSKLQRALAEEEDARAQEGDRLGATMESLQEAVRNLNAMREDMLQRTQAVSDHLRAALQKESLARGTKTDFLEGALRELRLGLAEEAQQREMGVRGIAEAITEERVAREAALARERRVSEEELARASAALRKTREEEERRLQERLLEVTSAVTEERDQRKEALWQERQRAIEAQEQLAREHKSLQRELAKLAEAVHTAVEGEARLAKDLGSQVAALAARSEELRAGQTAEAQHREAEARALEQRAAELETAVRAAAQERRDLVLELRQRIESEVAAREDALALERRAREAGHGQAESVARAVAREERELREAAMASLGKDVSTIRALVMEDAGRRDEERAGRGAALQKIRADVVEAIGEQRADAAAAREALDRMRAELSQLYDARKEDVDRLEANFAAVTARAEQVAKTSRDQVASLELLMQGLQSGLRAEAEERTSSVRQLDQRVAEDRRAAEAGIAAEARAREQVVQSMQESMRLRLEDESKRARAAVEKLAAQVGAAALEGEKSRTPQLEQARDLSKSVAALQRRLVVEEQARQESLGTVQRALEALREDLLSEMRERRGQNATVLDEVATIQRDLKHKDDRTEILRQELAAEVLELREKLMRELRLRDATPMPFETRQSAIRDRSPAPHSPPRIGTQGLSASPSMAAVALAGERWRQMEEEMDRTRSSLAILQQETLTLSKAVNGLDERNGATRNGLGAVQAALADAQSRPKVPAEVDNQIAACREEIRKESADRRAELSQVARAAHETAERLVAAAEQQRQKAEGALRQEVMDVRVGLKKEARERELLEARFAGLVREETIRREEAVDKEGRLRKEGEERLSEALHMALREERRSRERDLGGGGGVLRLEDAKAATPAADASLAHEQRMLRQAVGELQDRIAAAEMRQKSAEERTVTMLDAIMSGLTGPPDT